jgi:hypothetical protein
MSAEQFKKMHHSPRSISILANYQFKYIILIVYMHGAGLLL